MRKTLAGALTAVALVAGPVAIAAAPAEAAGSAVVTKSEYRKIRKGMSITRVHRIFDTRGKQSFHMSGYQSREYRTTKRYGFVMVDFERRGGEWKVSSKAAFWG